jgi:hypothetical protein
MKRLVYILLISLFFISCRKEKEPIPNENQNFSIPDDIKDYCFFKPGTFWVYQDSLTGMIDSMYVTDSYVGKDTVSSQDNVGYTGIFDFFNVYVYSTALGGEYLYWTDATYWQAPGLQNIPRVYIKNTTIMTGYNESVLMFTNEYLNNNVLYTDNGGQINYSGLMSFTNSYYNFQNVKKYNSTKNYTVFGHPTIYCLKKNVGLINYKILPGGVDNTSYSANWKIKNYYIVQ